MKTSQWVGALVVLAVMVFGVTYFKNYVGSTPEDPKVTQATAAGPSDEARLAFPEGRKYPGENLPPLTLQHKKPGHHDFWFRNDSGRDLRVGLAAKNCKCQGVDLFYLPAAEAERLQSPGVAAAVGAASGPSGALTPALAAGGRDRYALLEPHARSVTFDLQAHTEAVVPAGSVGWVRMNWTGEKAGAQNLVAAVWMADPDLGVRENLEVHANFVEPVRLVEAEVVAGDLKLRQLPHTAYLTCWSPTLDHFGLKAELAPRLRPGPDTVTVGAPEPLSPELRARMQAIAKEPVRFAYRVPVTLHKLAADGKTPCDLGMFRRQVTLTPDGGLEPLTAYVSGTVLGDVAVGSSEDRGRVTFASFDRHTTRTRAITLHTAVPGVRLELDKARLPDFLEAELTGPEDGALGRTWTLAVTVPAGRAYGRFPRDDDPTYRDSAVYLHTGGDVPQVIRVPVEGNATEAR